MNILTPEELIKNEFKSKFIELCSREDFVRHFITIPKGIEKFGFTPSTPQAKIEPFSSIKFGQVDQESGSKRFYVDYDLRGYFYHFDPLFEGNELDIKLTYSGILTENNLILLDEVRVR